MKRYDVLIAGAGPTGLMMACQLAMRNISFMIIDKNEDHTTQSRALVVHARSMEIFDQMGIAHEAINLGKKARAVNMFINGKHKLRFDLTGAGEGLTAFPYLLILEQSKTEKLLNDLLARYGHSVERNTELVGLMENNRQVIASLKRNSGETEQIEVKWIVGADGANSFVRRSLGILFSGKTYKESLYVIDCKVDLDLPHDEMVLSFSEVSFAGLFPMTNGRCRVLGIVPKEYQDANAIGFNEIADNFSERTRLNVKLSDPEWVSTYHSHHRAVDSFRKGRCFLAGDAAHIHSPVGAQGMNTGLQDAYNLAWKLALVIQGKAKEEILDTYNEERIAIAHDLVRTTDRAFHFVTNQSAMAKFFRLRVMPLAIKIVLPLFERWTFIRNLAFIRVSEIGLHYRNRSLSREDAGDGFDKDSPKPGDRAPYVPKLTKNTIKFELIVFYGDQISEPIRNQVRKFAEEYSDIAEVTELEFSRDTAPIYIKFGISGKGCYLLRPDNYIAYRDTSVSITNVVKYIGKILK